MLKSEGATAVYDALSRLVEVQPTSGSATQILYAPAGGLGLAGFETWVGRMHHCGKVVGSVNFSLCALQSFSLTGPGSWKA